MKWKSSVLNLKNVSNSVVTVLSRKISSQAFKKINVDRSRGTSQNSPKKVYIQYTPGEMKNTESRSEYLLRKNSCTLNKTLSNIDSSNTTSEEKYRSISNSAHNLKYTNSSLKETKANTNISASTTRDGYKRTVIKKTKIKNSSGPIKDAVITKPTFEELQKKSELENKPRSSVIPVDYGKINKIKLKYFSSQFNTKNQDLKPVKDNYGTNKNKLSHYPNIKSNKHAKDDLKASCKQPNNFEMKKSSSKNQQITSVDYKEHRNSMKKSNSKNQQITSVDNQEDGNSPKANVLTSGCRLAYDIAVAKFTNDLGIYNVSTNNPSWEKQEKISKLQHFNKESHYKTAQKKWDSLPKFNSVIQETITNGKCLYTESADILKLTNNDKVKPIQDFAKTNSKLVIDNVLTLFNKVKESSPNVNYQIVLSCAKPPSRVKSCPILPSAKSGNSSAKKKNSKKVTILELMLKNKKEKLESLRHSGLNIKRNSSFNEINRNTELPPITRTAYMEQHNKPRSNLYM